MLFKGLPQSHPLQISAICHSQKQSHVPLLATVGSAEASTVAGPKGAEVAHGW